MNPITGQPTARSAGWFTAVVAPLGVAGSRRFRGPDRWVRESLRGWMLSSE